MTYIREQLSSSNLAMRAAKQWNRLLREVVLSPSWALRPDWIRPRVTWSDLRGDPVLSRRLDLMTS